LKQFSPARPLRLVGHSMGGNVAGLYAGAMPERVQAFVNIEGFGLPDSDPDTAPARYRVWIRNSHKTPAFSEFPDFAALAERIRRRSPRMTMAQAEFVARQWAVAGDDGTVQIRADPRHKLPNAVLYRRSEAEACWRQASADVLLVAGSDSHFIPAKDAGQASSIPDLPFPRATGLLIEDSGHMPHFEQPGVLARVIERFFGKTL
jgi:pimeloyl-ACP methyl ester carboxylesterase